MDTCCIKKIKMKLLVFRVGARRGNALTMMMAQSSKSELEVGGSGWGKENQQKYYKDKRQLRISFQKDHKNQETSEKEDTKMPVEIGIKQSSTESELP